MARHFLGTRKGKLRWFFWILNSHVSSFGCLKWECSVGNDVGWKHTSLQRIAHLRSNYSWTNGKRTCQCYTGHTLSVLKTLVRIYHSGNFSNNRLLLVRTRQCRNEAAPFFWTIFQALLTGCSAGGLATILHCDDFSARFPHDVSVKCLADAGFFLDV
jgi:hypothetical protein